MSPDYFATVELPLLAGREFTDRDREGAPGVAIVNRAMARRFWPNGGAIGKRITLGGEPSEREIIAVAQNAKLASIGAEPEPYVYLPALQRYRPSLTLHVRTSIAPAQTIDAVTTIVRAIDRNVPAYDGLSLRESMAFSLVPVAIARTVLGVSGAIGLVLALGGLYGVVAYTVAQRIKEIGIGVAQGATRSHIFGVIVGGALKLAAIGVVLGLAGAAAGTRLLRVFLYGSSATDPVTFALVATLMLAVAIGASYGAARRGMNVDPMVALRHE